MTRAEIYRRAAEVGAEKGFPYGSCWRICEQEPLFKVHEYDGLHRYEYFVPYQDVFMPECGGPFWADSWSEDLAEKDSCRVLALCFAAAMAETGDL